MNRPFENDFLTPDLPSLKKRAILKLAVNLVKADSRIHDNEIILLNEIRLALGLAQEEMDMIHYASTENAISLLADSEDGVRKAVINCLARLMKADSDIDFEEAILLAAVELALDGHSKDWVRIVTAVDSTADISSRQIVYLEQMECEAPRILFNDKYDNLLISKTLSDIGLDLFYLPGVLEDLSGEAGTGESKFGLLQQSMEYLIPARDKVRIRNLSRELHDFDIQGFCDVVLSHHGLKKEQIPFDAFLMVKIKDDYLLDDANDYYKTADFLCIDVSTDVKRRILSFVSKLDARQHFLSYEGYFKILYDFLSAEAKTASRILIDANYEFRLLDKQNEKITFASSPQSRTFYLLLLKYVRTGISQDCFHEAIAFLEAFDFGDYVADGLFDIHRLVAYLRGLETEVTDLICDTIWIYSTLSTKDNLSPDFPQYIISILKHRSSLKNYVNKGLMSMEKLFDPKQFCIGFDKESKTYRIPANLSNFSCKDRNGNIIQLKYSELWEKLARK